MSRAALVAALVVATPVAAQWYGFRPSASVASAVELVDLTDGAVVNRVIGTLQLTPGEYAWPDAVRCLPGFCLIATTVNASNPGAATTYITRVNTADASVIAKVGAPGVCAHMHVDFSTGNAYTLCLEDAATGYRAIVTEVSGATHRAVADVTTSIARGRVAPGQTTHCSATHSMYVGVDNGGAGNDLIVTVDLTAGRATATTKLTGALPRSIWATCDGSGVVGGISFQPGAGAAANGTATFGTFSAGGVYVVDSKVGVPPNHEPSGLLTATSPASYQDAFIAAFYPAGTLSNATAANGVLWNVDPYGGGSDDFVVPFGYYLIGAAWDREG